MLEITLEAIEADLSFAEANFARPIGEVALVRAQIRARLLAAQIIAEGQTTGNLDIVNASVPVEPVDEDDVFAEARRARKQK